MHAILFATAALALAGAHLLRLPTRSSAIAATLAFLAALAVTATLIRLGASHAGLGRTTPFDGFVNQAVAIAEEDDTPLILLTGASFSRNAVDDTALTAALQARGYAYRAINLSLEAASMVERDAHLAQFLNASPRAPDLVFIEIAQVTDQRPTFIFQNSKFSTRAIEQFTPAATLRTAQGLAERNCFGPVDCAKEAVFLSLHAVLNAVNIGLVGQGELTARVPPAAAYDAVNEARTEIDPAWRSEELSDVAPAAPINGPHWAMEFRRLQRARLLEQGISGIGYYFPPVIDAGLRAYVTGLCAGELAEQPCISPDDPALLSQLDGAVWLDAEHLLAPGAEAYTAWLADRLIATGLLEASP